MEIFCNKLFGFQLTEGNDLNFFNKICEKRTCYKSSNDGIKALQEKTIKFYHFKRKIKEAQGHIPRNSAKKLKPQASQKSSKVVHTIYKIIENYTEKCSISKIRVNENSKKLIIESNDQPQQVQTPRRCVQSEDYEENAIDPALIKTEPSLLCESNFVDESVDEENYFHDEYDDELESDDYTQATTSKHSVPRPMKIGKRAQFTKKRGKDPVQF